MEIDPQIAATIVSNIKDVLRHEINLFDTHGHIISSTDVSRIGTYHDAAMQAARDHRTIYVDDEHQYAGAKNGINTPVVIDGQVVAVIGVTGEREAVESFGNVIRKMTEILLRENIEQTAKFNRRISQANLINQLIAQHQDSDIIRYLAASRDWDRHASHRIVVGRVTSLASIPDDATSFIPEHVFSSMPNVLVTADADECCLILNGDDSADDIVQRIAAQLESNNTKAVFGASGTTNSVEQLPRLYEQAQLALHWCLFDRSATLMHIEDLDFGLIVPSMPREAMKQFVERVFAGLDETRISAHFRTFQAYASFNGGITRAAQSLFIHKNTMQNHLDTIARDTGYNPRDLRDFSVLDTAFRLYYYLRFTDTLEGSATARI